MQAKINIDKVIRAIELLRIDNIDGKVDISFEKMVYLEELYDVLVSTRNSTISIYLDLFELKLLSDYL